jgi:hypothetical protein
MSDHEVAFDDSAASDLIPGWIYRGGSRGHQGDDPLHPLLGGGNAGGFRACGKEGTRYAALYSTGSEKEWPDHFIDGGDRFVYYGDQRTPGLSVLDTPRGGNRLLQHVFEQAATDRLKARAGLPPLFLFTKAGLGRDVEFHGLAVPAGPSSGNGDGLIETTRDYGSGMVFNYEARFDVIRPSIIERAWLDDVRAGRPMSVHGPAEWFKWIVLGSR